MLVRSSDCIRNIAASNSVGAISVYGLLVRLVLLAYSIYHDLYVDHIKYTDIDYHVFTNGSKALVNQKSPYEDPEYRYPPLVAFLFVPNILLGTDLFGKLILIITDILCGHLIYRLNIHQGTDRIRSKIFLIVWLFNPVTLAISTRGSFEPVLTVLILSSVYLLISNELILAGLVYGLAIHLKLYPIIYSLCFYSYIIQRRPYLITQAKVIYWMKTISPGSNHLRFFISTIVSLSACCYVSYRCFGQDYIENSFIYHLKRKDLQHNFSVYFYLFRLLPQYQELLSSVAFVIQSIAILTISLVYFNLDTNRRVKSRKLCFSLFATTFLFVSLNKVCTSQYFSWYLTFMPLILDSLDIRLDHAGWIAMTWLLSQANWLLFAYLYEYRNFDVLDYVGNSSILFLMSNMWILSTLCNHFKPNLKYKKEI